MAGKYDIEVYRETGGVFVFAFAHHDLTAAQFKMQARYRAGDEGNALLTLTNAAPGAQGISCTSAIIGDTRFSFVRIEFLPATLAQIPFAAPRSMPVIAAYDLIIFASAANVWAAGNLIIQPGVTDL